MPPAPHLQRRARAAVGAALLALAVAAPATQAQGTAAAPAKRAGWLVDRARFEPIDDGVLLGVGGLGDYRGAVEVAPTGGSVAVVNDVGLEDYVRGISEVPSTWPAEALKAQAVAARTYALHELQSPAATAAKGVGAQICATEACQVYAGAAKERQPGGDRWAQAVTETAGQVLVFQGRPILAKYSSSNGGAIVPGGRPYLRAAPDPDDAASPLHRWRSALPLTDVAAAFGLPGPIEGAGRSGAGIVLGWRAQDGVAGQTVVAPADFSARLNNTLGPPPGVPRPVPSFRFAVTLDHAAGVLVLDGSGFGHGIGLSQWGAFGKARRGMKAPDILAAYYGGLRPVAVPPAQLPATVRVAVDLGRPQAEVGSTTGGRFRVLDQAGHPLATVASGAWRVVPEGRRVRVVPPAGQDAAPAVQLLSDEPRPARVRLTAPALVRVVVQDEAGTPVAATDALPANPGDLTLPVPSPASPGRYSVVVTADAGGGRTAQAALPLEVSAPPPAAPSRVLTAAAPGDHGAPGPGPLHALAALLLAAATGATAATARTHRARR